MKDERLPLAALILMTGQGLYNSVIYVIGLIVIGFQDRKDGGWVVWIIVGCGLLLVLASTLVRYLRFTYRLADSQVVIKSGLFVRKTRHIPYAKIQTLRHQQWFFLKPFNLESLVIETSSQNGKEGEAQLYAVAPAVGEEIEARRKMVRGSQAPSPVSGEKADAGGLVEDAHSTGEVTGTPSTEAAEASAPTARYLISAHDLNVYALTSLGFIPILTGALWLWGKFDDIVPKGWERNIDHYMAQLAAAAVLALIVFVLIIGILISYLRLLQKYYQFTLTQNGDTLTAARGLLKRTQVSTRLHQLQAVRFSQTVVRQWFHLTTVQGLIASNASDDETSNAMVLMPVVKEDKALATMRRFITWLPDAVPALQPVLRKRFWYYVRNSVLAGSVLAVGVLLAVYFWRPSWLPIALGLGVAWLVFTAFQGAYAARSAGVRIVSPDLLVLQKGGWWRRQRFFVRRVNIQSLEVNTSYWLAKKQVAHLVINVREGDNNESIEVSYLEQAVADTVRAWYRPADFQGGSLI